MSDATKKKLAVVVAAGGDIRMTGRLQGAGLRVIAATADDFDAKSAGANVAYVTTVDDKVVELSTRIPVIFEGDKLPKKAAKAGDRIKAVKAGDFDALKTVIAEVTEMAPDLPGAAKGTGSGRPGKRTVTPVAGTKMVTKMYRGYRAEGVMHADGQIEWMGKVYTSLTAASNAVTQYVNTEIIGKDLKAEKNNATTSGTRFWAAADVDENADVRADRNVTHEEVLKATMGVAWTGQDIYLDPTGPAKRGRKPGTKNKPKVAAPAADSGAGDDSATV